MADGSSTPARSGGARRACGLPGRALAVVATVPGVAELSAAATSDRLAAVWIGADNTLSTSSASLADMAFTPARSLGATEPFEAARTGRLAASATPAGRLLALARTIDEPCQRYDAPSCANFAILDLLEVDASHRP
ncbi:MAG TPA: hypothetical protein ENK57_06145, partial [Polyangiaceae bacterium]|nr:hypothetical protein [Polyangiaceae bacterium]